MPVETDTQPAPPRAPAPRMEPSTWDRFVSHARSVLHPKRRGANQLSTPDDSAQNPAPDVKAALRAAGFSEDYVRRVPDDTRALSDLLAEEQTAWKEGLTKRDVIYHSSAFAASTSGIPVMLWAYRIIERGDRFKRFSDIMWPDTNAERRDLIDAAYAARREREEEEYRRSRLIAAAEAEAHAHALEGAERNWGETGGDTAGGEGGGGMEMHELHGEGGVVVPIPVPTTIDITAGSAQPAQSTLDGADPPARREGEGGEVSGDGTRLDVRQ